MEPGSSGSKPRRRGVWRAAGGTLVLALLAWSSIRPAAAEEVQPVAPLTDEARTGLANEALPEPRLADAEREHEDRPYWRTNLFKRIFTDQKFLVTQWWPAEFKRPGFTAPLVGTTAFALTSQHGGYDARFGNSVDEITGPASNGIAGDLTSLGNGPAIAALLGVTYLGARWSGHDRMARASSLAAESMIDAGIWIEVLKRAFARVRPNNPGAGQFFMYGAPQSQSFPSGHAMGSFAVATIFAEEYRDKRWVPWVAYGSATLISFSRVALGRHYPADVITGAMLGNSIGRGVYARQSLDDAERGWAERITPVVDPQNRGYGLAYTYTW